MAERPPIRSALVGAGYISASHAPAWAASPDARLVAICDLDLGRAEARRDQLATLGVNDVALYTDVDRMLDEVRPDCVDLATRPETHHLLIEKAARRGVHVLCQKPLAPTLAQGEAMAAVCRDAGVRFMVLEMFRYIPWYRDLARHIAAGAIGTPHYLRITGPRRPMRRERPVDLNQPYFADMPRLFIYEMCIHWIDAARYLMGEIETVYARAGRVNPSIVGEDWALLVYGHKGGGTSMIESSWGTPSVFDTFRREGDVLVEGSEGALFFEMAKTEIRLAKHDNSIAVVDTYPDLPRAFQSSFINCIGHFANAVRHATPFESSGEDNLRTLAATLGAYDSLASGVVVRV
jgi:predicted dehydrogenase